MKITRKEAIELDAVLANKKTTKLSDEVVFKLIDNKIELAKVAKSMEDARKIASEECKPEELKEEGAVATEAQNAKWNVKFGEYMGRYLAEEIDIEIGTLSKEEYRTIVKENEMTIGDAAILSLIRHD